MNASVVNVSADTYGSMLAAMLWYDAMPDNLKGTVGERFHENFRNWQEEMTPEFFSESTHYISHYEMVNGEPHVVLGTHLGGGGEGDLVAYKFVIG